MKGWLEKYNDGGPVQPNYNDASTSAGPGFEGDGYSNVGRNYSPAWGGQFKDGGPIYTTNPKDSRLQAYKDSSILYNNYVKQYSAKGENRPLTKEEIKLAIEQRENPRANYPNTKVLNVKGSNKVKKYHYSDSSGAYNAELVDDMFHPVIKPIGSYLYSDHNFWNTNINNIYKKPTQPVIYQKPEPTPQSTIDFMEGNYGQEPITEIPQASAYGEVVDPRTGYTHITRQGSSMYPMVGQNVPEMAMGGSIGGATQGIPGATGFMYARVAGSTPSKGKGRNKVYKTDASAQNGKEMKFYQEGLDFKPKSISKNGSVIKDDRGQWAHPGEITEIGSNQITMQGVPYPVMGVSDTGDMQMMYPNEEYQYDGESVTEYPMMAQGGQLTKLDQLTNFTNYNTKQPGGWLDKYQ
jgi:hypothetical protein